jgi:hypothetical protein
LADKGINPTQVLIEGAHDVGMKVHVGIRPAGWTYYQPYADMFGSAFYHDHPEWRTVDFDGTPVARMSWAVPEVRARGIDVLREAVQLGADGAHLVFNRGWPMVLFEPPFCRRFEEKHGRDPRTLDEADPRIADLHCEIVAWFLRETREMLDEEQAVRGDGKRLELSACVLGIEEDNLRYSFDLRRLVKEGLIDEVYPYKYGFGESQRVCDMDFYRSVCVPNNVAVRPIFSFVGAMEDNIREMLSLYEGGAAGVGVWDPVIDDARLWSAVSRMGRPDELKARLEAETQDRVFVPVHRMGGEVLDGRYPIFWVG